jgi:hypothetical protein
MRQVGVARHHDCVTDPFTPSIEPVDPNAVHAPPPTVGRASAVALDEPPATTPTDTQAPIAPAAPTTAPPSVPPSRRSRLPGLPPAWPLLLTAVVLFAAAIGFVALIAADPSGGKTHLRSAAVATPAKHAVLIAPAAIGDYRLANSSTDLRAALTGLFDKAPSSVRSKLDQLYGDAAIAMYTSGQDSLVLEAYRTADLPPGASPVQELSRLFFGTGKKVTTYTFKKTDIVRCGTTTFATQTTGVCLWQDPRTVGILIGSTRQPQATLAASAEAARVTLEK